LSDASNLSHVTKLNRIRTLARLLDTAVVIPGTKIRFGFDALLGLVPGVGDAVAAAFGAYVIHEAIKLGAPRATILKMVANLGIDFLVGSVPVAGDVFDVLWRANVRNADLLAEHVESLQRAARTSAAHASPQPAWRRWLLPSPQ
jgi:hypothetical protein